VSEREKSIIPDSFRWPWALSSSVLFLLPHSLENNSVGKEGAVTIGGALKHNRTLDGLK
jgi:hypothetical protein